MDFGGGLGNLQEDPNKIAKGFWVGQEIEGIVQNPDGTWPEFLIRTTYRTNIAHEQAKERWKRKHAKKKRTWDLPDHALVEMGQYAFAEACLLDWRNVQDANGKNIPFDRRLVHEYRRIMPKLFDRLSRAADEEAEDESEGFDVIVGESLNTSPTKSNEENQQK